MRLLEIYNLIVEEGTRHDPRGKTEVKNYLKNITKEYDLLSDSEKMAFDRERLTNPFSDTRVLYGNANRQVKNILTGIDMETQEILLAYLLNQRNKKIDLVLAHHPEGFARSIFYEVMDVQLDLLKKAGVSVKKAKELLDERKDEVMRKVMPANTMRPVDTARLLDIPFICAHTPADNFASEYIKYLIDKNKPKKVKEIIDILSEEPEYKYAVSTNAGPRLIHGRLNNRCGKMLVEMTGGTEGPKKIFPELLKAGVKTIIGMHMSEEHFKKAKKYSMNILIAGHISSDSLGLNLLLDAIDLQDELNIIPCSGFIRVNSTERQRYRKAIYKESISTV